MRTATPLFVLCALMISPALAPCRAQSRPAAESNRVGQWDLWEKTFESARPCANPFTDVRLDVTFTSPKGTETHREGFFDGDNRWRVRFAPDAIGTWTWKSRSTPEDPALNAEGSLECVGSALHGPLQVCDRNRLWFMHADKTPAYLLAFHLWQPDRMDAAVLARTLDDLAGQGFNAIVGPHIEPHHTVWAEPPGGDPDFSHFNLETWRNLDILLRLTAERGMVVIPFSILGGTNGIPAPSDDARVDLMLRYWVARWGGFWNATFQPFSEWEEQYKEDAVMRIGRRLHELDGGRHLVSVHSIKASPPEVQKAAWYDYHTVQDKLGDRTGQNKVQAGNSDPMKFTWFSELYKSVPRPILAQECLWEGNFYQGQAGLDIDNLRKGAWVIALSGAQINYADEVVAPRQPRPQNRRQAVTYSTSGAATSRNGRLYPALTHLARFMRNLPLERMKLHPELSNRRVCLAEPGHIYAAYTLGKSLRIDLKGLGSKATARWFDPRQGTFGNAFSPDNDGKFQPPSKDDWALLINAEAFAPAQTGASPPNDMRE